MVNVSRKSQYALRSLFELARRPAGTFLSAREIAKAQHIPVRFLEQLFRILRAEGLVHSNLGRRGGHSLARSPSEITVGQVVRLMDGPARAVRCPVANQDCARCGRCPFVDVWFEATGALQGVFDATTLQSLLDAAPPPAWTPDFCI